MRRASVLAFLWMTLCSLSGREEGESTDTPDKTSASDGKVELVRVEVAITALSGNSLYLDQGRDAGLAPGDEVRFFPSQGGTLRGKVVSVARTSARASFERGTSGLDLGRRGVALVPRTRLEALQAETQTAEPDAESTGDEEPEAEPGSPAIAHPPWTAPPPEWSAEMPLLAPAHGCGPEERERSLRGRTFFSVDLTDDSGDPDRRYYDARLGMDWSLENPFGRGGSLQLDAELFRRGEDIGGETDSESHLRIDRASYAWGGIRGRENRTEIGRFLQHEFPEFGFLDGVEYVARTKSGSRLGASVGFMPEPDDFFSSGDDLQAALFYRYVSGVDEHFSLGAGYQKTWHEGAADRDLLAATMELHADPLTSLFTSVLLDYYTSGDDLKSSGLELTQFHMNATRRTLGGHGLSLFASQFRWPQLARNEFPDVTAQEIADDHSTRYGMDGWYQLTSDLTLRGRIDRWSDQDDSGGGGSLRASLRDLFAAGEQLSVEAFVSGGKYGDSTGLRAWLSERLGRGSWGLSWDTTLFDQDAPGEEDLLEHRARLYLELGLPSRWSLSLYTESVLGDEEALSLGFVLQRSFD